MNIIKCGTPAITKIGQIESIVTSSNIRFNSVTYELSYFHNGDYKTVWLNENEFEIEHKSKIKIGFK